jgi:hypothetical protein
MDSMREARRLCDDYAELQGAWSFMGYVNGMPKGIPAQF